MMKPTLILVFISASAIAQTSINAPAIGMLRDSTGSLRSVVGVGGNFIVNDAGVSNVLSAAFSSRAGLVKTENQILVLDPTNQLTTQIDAAPGRALFAFDATGSPALAYYSSTLFQFINSQLQPVSWTGNALSIALSNPSTAAILEQRDDGLWQTDVDLTSGNITNQSKISGISAPVMLLADGELLYTRGTDLVLRDRTGADRTLPETFDVDSFEPMGKDWIVVHETGGGRNFALHFTPKTLELYQLPEVTR